MQNIVHTFDLAAAHHHVRPGSVKFHVFIVVAPVRIINFRIRRFVLLFLLHFLFRPQYFGLKVVAVDVSHNSVHLELIITIPVGNTAVVQRIPAAIIVLSLQRGFALNNNNWRNCSHQGLSTHRLIFDWGHACQSLVDS
jgi:hypothetical protein